MILHAASEKSFYWLDIGYNACVCPLNGDRNYCNIMLGQLSVNPFSYNVELYHSQNAVVISPYSLCLPQESLDICTSL